MGTEDLKVTAMNMYRVGSIPTLVTVFLCLRVGPFPLVGLTLTWVIWGRNLALHIALKSVKSVCSNISASRPTFAKT